ncbi:MAG: PocR ligand-binding domain-containing protein [Chloroflexota bacterium]
MDNLLTARQVQETLKVDRTTIYRMLNDGRLSGVKVGNQWRFSAQDVQDLVSGAQADATPVMGVEASAKILPLSCMQPMQDVFAEVAEIGSIITDSAGNPLTQISNSCEFCNLVLSSEKGKKACQRSWRTLAQQEKISPEFTACHAGLQYARARISVRGETIALLISGQFYSEQPDLIEQEKRIEVLAQNYEIDPRMLNLAIQKISVMDKRLVNKISHWLSRVARSFEQISVERAEMLARLHQIAEMSQINIQN